MCGRVSMRVTSIPIPNAEPDLANVVATISIAEIDYNNSLALQKSRYFPRHSCGMTIAAGLENHERH